MYIVPHKFMIVAYSEVYQQPLLCMCYYRPSKSLTENVLLWRNPLHYSKDATRVSQVHHMYKTGINVLKLFV